jgi:hypothetical protein
MVLSGDYTELARMMIVNDDLGMDLDLWIHQTGIEDEADSIYRISSRQNDSFGWSL